MPDPSPPSPPAGRSDADAWDRLWANVQSVDADVPPPSPRVVGVAARAWAAGHRRVLDLGCGPGRHAAYLAARGFEVWATDHSPVALAACRRVLAAAGVSAAVGLGTMTRIDLADASLDWVVAVNVLYHGLRSEMRAALHEVRRVLRPGGWLLATFLSEADGKLRWYRDRTAAGEAVELEPGTYCALVRGPTDEHVPHTFLSADDFRAGMLDGFDLLEVDEERVDGTPPPGGGPQSADGYWHVLARRPAG